MGEVSKGGSLLGLGSTMGMYKASLMLTHACTSGSSEWLALAPLLLLRSGRVTFMDFTSAPKQACESLSRKGVNFEYSKKVLTTRAECAAVKKATS